MLQRWSGLRASATCVGGGPGTPFLPASAALTVRVVVADDASAQGYLATLSGFSQFRARESVDDPNSLTAALWTGSERHLVWNPMRGQAAPSPGGVLVRRDGVPAGGPVKLKWEAERTDKKTGVDP
jgi:hypothetical protein